jgi:hypothetical protein
MNSRPHVYGRWDLRPKNFASGSTEGRASNGQPVRKGDSGAALATERCFSSVSGVARRSVNDSTVPLTVMATSGLVGHLPTSVSKPTPEAGIKPGPLASPKPSYPFFIV